ncbi:MAG: FAD/NAD(P)-binding protein, partial [Thermomicrobiales bacterium]
MEFSDVQVAIVGAGFTGVALAIQLCRRTGPGARILLAGDESSLGVAYGAAAPMHLLNVAAGRMSLDPAAPGDFVAWLTAHGYDGEQAEQGVPLPERYLPRAIYGRYVLDRFAEACAASPAEVIRVEDTITHVERDGERWRVQFASAPPVTAGAVALCLGNLPPRLPLPPDAVAPGALDRVISNPWRDPRMAEISPEDRVLVLGTGLTMVDYVLEWDLAGRTGETCALSRRGLL